MLGVSTVGRRSRSPRKARTRATNANAVHQTAPPWRRGSSFSARNPSALAALLIFRNTASDLRDHLAGAHRPRAPAPRPELLERSWRVIGPSGDTLEYGIYQRDAGL